MNNKSFQNEAVRFRPKTANCAADLLTKDDSWTFASPEIKGEEIRRGLKSLLKVTMHYFSMRRTDSQGSSTVDPLASLQAVASRVHVVVTKCFDQTLKCGKIRRKEYCMEV